MSVFVEEYLTQGSGHCAMFLILHVHLHHKWESNFGASPQIPSCNTQILHSKQCIRFHEDIPANRLPVSSQTPVQMSKCHHASSQVRIQTPAASTLHRTNAN